MKMSHDKGCPTCGSMNFKQLEMTRENNTIERKYKCNNCKKFWFE